MDELLSSNRGAFLLEALSHHKLVGKNVKVRKENMKSCSQCINTVDVNHQAELKAKKSKLEAADESAGRAALLKVLGGK